MPSSVRAATAGLPHGLPNLAVRFTDGRAVILIDPTQVPRERWGDLGARALEALASAQEATDDIA